VATPDDVPAATTQAEETLELVVAIDDLTGRRADRSRPAYGWSIMTSNGDNVPGWWA
jgi:hypothetical protein